MRKVRLPLFGKSRSFADVNADATEGATVGRDLRWPNGELVTEDELRPPSPPEPFPITIWRRILEIPAHVVALAKTITTGIYVITGDGTSATREITVSPRLLIENADGVAGDPFLDIADSTLLAGGPVSALRVVVAEDGSARYPDIDDVGDALRVAGVTVTAADAAAAVRVRTDGELVDAGWTWSPGVVWCGADGVLTQVLPATGWLLEVGRALAPDRIVLDLQTPYIRSV